ncbi:helix-turn-helix domain-containing protein [Pseudoroseomonas cervicalis]|uniref:IclR family transcriptional regulator domain-containing protein n=1 Tax=Teichococcus cervicalis TaxID=204525 RepID=UPI0022F1C324|nr:helix-turn-helix domain-containing protein [Pseudoroseomonas cervicalis]WBV41591.1 helix-turn-helix domain-containing protein [Pseudoroseomonas cervicalis]
MPSYEPVTALLRGLEVLRAVNRLRGATVREIHAATGINQPTVVRMLETLIHAGFVARQEEPPRYLPTGRTLELSAGHDLPRELGLAAAPVMSRLRRGIGWPSDIAVFDGDAMVVLHTSRGEGGRFLFERRPGFRAPILATSLGLAYLAHCREEERHAAVERAARQPEPWNDLARQPEALARRLDQIRAQGYAQMDEAYATREYGGMASAIGVPVLEGTVAIAALNLMYLRGTTDREAVVHRLLPALRQAADELGATLAGFRRRG